MMVIPEWDFFRWLALGWRDILTLWYQRQSFDASCTSMPRVLQIVPHTPLWLHAEHVETSKQCLTFFQTGGPEIQPWNRGTCKLATALPFSKVFQRHFCSELIDNSRNKATMADELNAGVENGNLSDKDIIIAYVYLLKRSSSFSKIHIPFQVGWPNRLWEEFCRFFSFFFSFDCHYNIRPQVRWRGSRNWRPL